MDCKPEGQIQIEIDEQTEIGDLEAKTLANLIEKIFGQWDPKWFWGRLNCHRKPFLLVAYVGKEPAGFKLGYEQDRHEFYSWLGGVLPEYRGLGIATKLMQHQHNWCHKRGYLKIQTKTQNRFRHMLLLNIKHGFDIIGTHASDEGGMKIILEKKLEPCP